MSLTVWLIRHGQTTINAGTWSNQPTEAPLTDLGKQQSLAAANRIPKAPDRIITSPLLRARESAKFIEQRFPTCKVDIGPIQEFIYLSPDKLQRLDAEARKKRIDAYWTLCDPLYTHGPDTESFNDFLKRIEQFQTQIAQMSGFIVVVGHGQFFKAWQLGLSYGFEPTSAWMQRFRQEEVQNPVKNGEIIELNGAFD